MVVKVLEDDATTLDVRSLLPPEEYTRAYDELGGGTSPHWAVKWEDTAMVADILAADRVDVNAKDGYETTALHWAVRLRNMDIVNVMVTKHLELGKFDLNAVVGLGYTALHWATLSDDTENIDMVRELLKCKDTMSMVMWMVIPLRGSCGCATQCRTMSILGVQQSFLLLCHCNGLFLGHAACCHCSPYFIKRTVEKLRNNLLTTAVLLPCSVFFVIVAFGIAGCIVLTPILELQWYMMVPTIFGGLVCLISLAFLSKSMWEDSLRRESVAMYEWSPHVYLQIMQTSM